MTVRWWLLGLCALARLAGACEGLAVNGAWIREAPPGAMVLAGYGELRNEGARALRITAVESTQFKHVMLHETVMEGGKARMVARDVLLIAPAAQAVLAPGGLHLMLMHGQAPLAAGQSVDLDFVCGATRTTLRFPVRRAAP